MDLRDEIETTLRAWDAYEVNRQAPAVIDFDCHPTDVAPEPATSRLQVYRRLRDLHDRATRSGAAPLVTRLNADLAYLRALLGERPPLADYIRATQGCSAAGWDDDHISQCGERASAGLAALGIGWGPDTTDDLRAAEGPMAVGDAPDAIHQAANDLEGAVRAVTGTDAPFELSIETADIDVYWAYWLDGAGHRARLRLNLRNAGFTRLAARQFALHEVLGHALQSASWSAHCLTEDVPWVRIMSVHAPQQVLSEGLAQALPLFVTPDDELMIARVHLDHYTQLVRSELHLAINAGVPAEACARKAQQRAPFWSDAQISDLLTDRGTDPLLRCYLWAYPAGLDWFTHLAETDPATTECVIKAAYRDPLTPEELAALWPAGPPIGGPGTPRT